MLRPIFTMGAALAMIASSPLHAQSIKWAQIHRVEGVNTHPTSTHDGKRIYIVRDSQVVMFEPATRKETVVRDLPVGYGGLSLSRQGDRLGFLRRMEDGRNWNAWTIALNPATGLAVGNPVRLSLRPVNWAPVFSPDGKTVALVKDFLGDKESQEFSGIMLAPANGGPERVILKSTDGYHWPVNWTPDGKTLYVGLSYDEESATARNGILRVPTDGSPSQMVAYTADWGGYPGLTPDGKFLAYWKPGSWDSIVVQTVEGSRVAAIAGGPGLPDVPLRWNDGYRGYARTGFRPRALSLRLTNPERTIAFTDSFPNPPLEVQWSPDGKRAAIFGQTPPRISIMDAEGRITRRIPVRSSINASRGIQWSPDGQRLMYRAVGPDEGIHIVDVATGTETALKSAGGRPIWRSDSRAVLSTARSAVAGTDSMAPIKVLEFELNGRERELRTINAFCRPAECDIKLLNDSLAITWRNNEYRVTPLRHSGEARIVYTRQGSGQPVPTISKNGQWMAVRVAIQGERLPRRIDVMRVDGSDRRTVELNTTTLSGPENPIVSNDGRELLVLGEADGAYDLHRVDVASGRATRVTTLRVSDRAGITPRGISPDGRSILFHAPLPPYTLIYESDMSALLQSWSARR